MDLYSRMYVHARECTSISEIRPPVSTRVLELLLV